MRTPILTLLLTLLLPLLSSARSVDAPDSVRITPAPSLPASITPVDIDRDRPQQPGLHYYDRHGNPLETPVRFLLDTDTIVRPNPGPKYPLFNGISVGVNFFDAFMMIFGQRRANFDASVSCSLWNWLIPTAEIGIGYSNSRPDDGRTIFKVRPSLYTKLGFNYNFLYKSNPDYKVYAGFRVGFSSFNYSIPHIAAGSQYYTDASITSVSGLHARSVYGEALLGLEVKIWRSLSMGWSARYAFNFKNTWSDPAYPAWFIPGRNASTPISATFSLIWHIIPPKSPQALDFSGKNN